MTKLQNTLCELASTNLQVDQEAIAEGRTFEQLDLDSLELIEFVVVLENQFAVKVADDEITPDFTVTDVAKLLETKGVAS